MTNSYDAQPAPRDLDAPMNNDLAAALKYDVLESGANFERKLRAMSDFYANSANFVATLTAQIKDSK